jgi:hypothetical protein
MKLDQPNAHTAGGIHSSAGGRFESGFWTTESELFGFTGIFAAVAIGHSGTIQKGLTEQIRRSVCESFQQSFGNWD